jgi:hypothetical protein
MGRKIETADEIRAFVLAMIDDARLADPCNLRCADLRS